MFASMDRNHAIPLVPPFGTIGGVHGRLLLPTPYAA